MTDPALLSFTTAVTASNKTVSFSRTTPAFLFAIGNPSETQEVQYQRIQQSGKLVSHLIKMSNSGTPVGNQGLDFFSPPAQIRP